MYWVVTARELCRGKKKKKQTQINEDHANKKKRKSFIQSLPPSLVFGRCLKAVR